MKEKSTTRFLTHEHLQCEIWSVDEWTGKDICDYYTIYEVTCWECNFKFYVGEDTDLTDFELCPSCGLKVI